MLMEGMEDLTKINNKIKQKWNRAIKIKKEGNKAI